MPHVLDNMVVFDPEGRRVRLAQLWADRIAGCLVFVRHFGCLLCRQQIAAISPLVDRVKAMGADLIVIGQGSIEEARAFRNEEKLGIPLLTDPTRQSHGALGMRRGLASILTAATRGPRVQGLEIRLPSVSRCRRSAPTGRRCGDRTGRRGTLPVHQPGGG